MESTEGIRSELENLKSQLDVIDKKETVETENRLIDLSLCLVNVENKEFNESEANLRRLAEEVVNIEKTQFSFWQIFGVEYNELVHSNFLAWLFDPLGSHGLRTHFVEAFVGKVARKIHNLYLSRLDLSNIKVEREFPGDESRLDIRILDPRGSFQCVIENKILSEEGTDQTDRLYKNFRGKSQKDIFVFLTLDERAKPTNRNFTSLTYAEILPMLQRYPQASLNSEVRFLIGNYVNTLERLIVSENFKSFSESTKLYYRFQKDIEKVTKAFNTDRDLLLAGLEEQIQQRSWWDGEIWKKKRIGTDFNIWKEAWDPSGHKGVYLQLYLHKSEPFFSLWTYGEPLEFSAKFSPKFWGLLDKEYPDGLPGGFRKSAKGSNRIIEKDIPLSFTEKDKQEILKSLDEMVDVFGKIIDKSVVQFLKK